MLKRNISQKGFTLVEMIVAVALFSVVMLIGIGSLLSMVDANRRAQAIESVMNNLNVALDGMVRALRMGQKYQISSDGHTLSFIPFGSDPNDNTTRWEYTFAEVNSGGELRGRLYKSYIPYGKATRVTVPLTAEEVDIDYVKFYKTTDVAGDLIQPRVMMVVRGKGGFEQNKTLTYFNVQASATQRLLDL